MSEIDNNTKSTIKIRLIREINDNQWNVNSDGNQDCDTKDYVDIIPINLTKRQIDGINETIMQSGNKKIKFQQKIPKECENNNIKEKTFLKYSYDNDKKVIESIIKTAYNYDITVYFDKEHTDSAQSKIEKFESFYNKLGKDQNCFTNCFNSCINYCDNNCSEHYKENDDYEFVVVG